MPGVCGNAQGLSNVQATLLVARATTPGGQLEAPEPVFEHMAEGKNRCFSTLLVELTSSAFPLTISRTPPEFNAYMKEELLRRKTAASPKVVDEPREKVCTKLSTLHD